ncbi:TIGR02301 family protein [Phenylobacterium sp.]|jgi:uncharacterized protein (TIGR02301 family)|uniref:TIGR02301 family protein n=1 Tax=Phenylobacterium sp. TaxID=1871053 RepID=UPI002F3F2FD1
MRPPFFAVISLFLLAAPAAAEAPPADHRETLAALAEVLGQSHALRQACAGPDDQYWRARMMRLMEVERPQGDWKAELTGAFNAGYTSRRRLFPVCTPASRRAEMTAAARGRGLAGKLTQGARGDSAAVVPDAMAPDAPSR